MKNHKTKHQDETFTFKISKELLESVKEKARANDMSLSSYLRLLCKQGLKVDVSLAAPNDLSNTERKHPVKA